MKVQFYTQTLLVKFYYDDVDGRRKTTCKICKPDSKTPLFEGSAIQDSRDAFVKHIGRKRALTKALATWSREDRTEIWRSYLAQITL